MNRMLQSFLKETNIRRKMLALFAVFVVVPILLLSIYFSSSLAINILEGSLNFYSSSMEQLKYNVIDKLEQYCKIMVITASNQGIVRFMASDFSSDLETYNSFVEEMLPVMNRMKINNTELDYFLITDKLYQSRISSYIEVDHADADVISVYEMNRKDHSVAIHWLGIANTMPGSKKKEIVFSFPIVDFSSSSNSLLGLLYFKLNEESLYSLMNVEGTAGKNVIIIMDDQDRIITGTIHELVGHGGDEFKSGLIDKADIRMKDYNGTTYICLVSELNNESIGIKNWNMYFMIPFEQVQNNMNNVWITGIMIALLCIVITFSIIKLFLNNLSQRINNLVENFKDVGQGDFTVREPDEGKDEIAVLDRNFQDMVIKLKNLIQQVYNTQLLLKEAEIENQKVKNLMKSAELIALQNQINPHYLFNTLESIRMNLVIKDDRETANIVEIFSQSFRNNLYGYGDNTRICDELEFVEKYLLIQKYRYGNKISYSIYVEEGLEKNFIPRFIIQPLIENSIYHGLEMKDGQGRLDVSICMIEDYICIKIVDDGVGMDEETVQQIFTRAETESDEGSFFAITNIIHRLKLMFGDKYRLCIESEMGIQTKVQVYIPYNDALLPFNGNSGTAGQQALSLERRRKPHV